MSIDETESTQDLNDKLALIKAKIKERKKKKKKKPMKRRVWEFFSRKNNEMNKEDNPSEEQLPERPICCKSEGKVEKIERKGTEPATWETPDLYRYITEPQRKKTNTQSNELAARLGVCTYSCCGDEKKVKDDDQLNQDACWPPDSTGKEYNKLRRKLGWTAENSDADDLHTSNEGGSRKSKKRHKKKKTKRKYKKKKTKRKYKKKKTKRRYKKKRTKKKSLRK